MTLSKAITISKILYKFSMTSMQLKLFPLKSLKPFFAFLFFFLFLVYFLNVLINLSNLIQLNYTSEDRLSIGNVLTFLVLNQYVICDNVYCKVGSTTCFFVCTYRVLYTLVHLYNTLYVVFKKLYLIVTCNFISAFTFCFNISLIYCFNAGYCSIETYIVIIRAFSGNFKIVCTTSFRDMATEILTFEAERFADYE